MSILLRSADFIYTFRFLKLLVTPFEKTAAFKEGVIDKDGNKIKGIEMTDSMKSAYTPFHKLVFNVKKIIGKLPGGSSQIATFAAALYLIKEKYGIDIDKVLKESKVNTSEIYESVSNWYQGDDGILLPGIYKTLHPKVLNDSFDDLVRSGDQVRITDAPIGNVHGIDIYEATHLKTNKKVYVALGEITR